MTIDVVGSKLPPENGYGQNGFHGPSSDLPGQRTKINAPFAPPDPLSDVSLTDQIQEGANWQTRKVSQEAYPATFGHHTPNSKIDFPVGIDRRKVSVAAKSGSYKR